jgi:hypothetical protein
LVRRRDDQEGRDKDQDEPQSGAQSSIAGLFKKTDHLVSEIELALEHGQPTDRVIIGGFNTSRTDRPK